MHVDTKLLFTFLPMFGAVHYVARVTGADGKTKDQHVPLPPPSPPPPHPGLHQNSLWQQELFPAVTRDAAIALLPSPASTASTPGCHCHHDPAQTLTISLAVTFIAYGAEGCCSATAAPSPSVPPLLLRFPGLQS